MTLRADYRSGGELVKDEPADHSLRPRTSTASRSAATSSSAGSYLRGSTLFVVWNMSTFDAARPDEFSALQDLGSAFGADGTHVFMVKMNSWLGL